MLMMVMIVVMIFMMVIVRMTMAMAFAVTVAVFDFFVMMMFDIFHNATFFPLIHRLVIAVIFGGKSGKFFAQPSCKRDPTPSLQPSCIIAGSRFSLATA